MNKNLRLSAIIDQLVQKPTQILSAHIAVGELVTFSDEQINQQWRESPLAYAVLKVRRVPAVQQCMACFEKYHPIQKEVACPHCGGRGAKIISGEEFFLESIEE